MENLPKSFDDLIKTSEKPVLVDFTATWCGPCKALAPIVDQVAEELEGQIKVGKVDIDESPGTASKYGIRGVPTLLVIQNGEVKTQHVGLTTKAKLIALVNG